MKNINYESDLDTDIRFLNDDFPELRKKELRSGFISSSVFSVIIMLYSIITNYNFSLIRFFLLNCILGCGNFILNYKKNDKIINLGRLIAEAKVNELIRELDRNDVKITKENLMDSDVYNTHKIDLVEVNDNDLDFFVVDTNYFCLLDNDDKIRVLKQIRKTLLDGRNNPNEVTLHLLEDHEVEKEEIPFKKKLTRK